MIRRLTRWMVLVGMTGPVLFGVTCTAQVRDALTAGALDFLSGTTTETLSAIISLDGTGGDDEQ